MKKEGIFSDLADLETERLRLRKMTLVDAPDMFAYASDPEVARYVTWAPHQTLDDSLEFIQSVLLAYDQGQVTSWGVEHKADKKLIGTCGFIRWDTEQNSAEIGYALSRAYWHQGLMTEAASAAVDFAFQQMGVYRLEAFCDPANIGSARVMEKLGMTFEGTLRAFFFAKGRYRDMRVYSILRPEWSQSVP
jgi:ribosomal-protein-alanine N-acetyltransferase